MKHTPLNNAQVALTEEEGIEKSQKENSKTVHKKYKKILPRKRCVIM